MKILVTGGAGFIGSHLVDILIATGNQVLVIDNLSSGIKENLNPKADFEKMNVESVDISSVFKKFKPDIVYHLAAQKDVRFSTENTMIDANINIVGSLNILENCVKNRVKKIVFTSSGGAIYDFNDKIPLNENSRENPISPYGIAKYSVDFYLRFFKLKFGLQYVSLRFANIYGPRQDPYGEAGVVAIFFEKLLSNSIPHINGGTQTRDFIYVGDAVEALIKSMNSKKASGIYAIGTGKETNINDLYKKIQKICETNIIARKRPFIIGEVKRNAISSMKAERDFGWTPKIDLKEGLNLTYKWFKTMK